MARTIYEFTQLPHVTSHVSADGRPESAHRLGKAPKVGVIYNPRSHHNRGADLDCGVNPQVHISQPGDRSQLPEALSKFAATGIDLLVINGGDGTVRDVLTCGASIFGNDWPAIAVLPKGKTNALTVDLGVPKDWSLQHAIDAFEKGRRIHRHPVEITRLDDEEKRHVLGFVLGAGSFTTATNAGQGAHRLGAFNSLVVAVTVIWGVTQWLLASRANPWRRGAKMDIRLGAQEAPMWHSGVGDPEWRQFLVATTFENLPAGVKPFGNLRKGLKLGVLDQISRRTAMKLPALIRGKVFPDMRERGMHQISVPQFLLTIDDQIIFDGEAFPAGEYRVAQGPELEFVSA